MSGPKTALFPNSALCQPVLQPDDNLVLHNRQQRRALAMLIFGPSTRRDDDNDFYLFCADPECLNRHIRKVEKLSKHSFRNAVDAMVKHCLNSPRQETHDIGSDKSYEMEAKTHFVQRIKSLRKIIKRNIENARSGTSFDGDGGIGADAAADFVPRDASGPDGAVDGSSSLALDDEIDAPAIDNNEETVSPDSIRAQLEAHKEEEAFGREASLRCDVLLLERKNQELLDKLRDEQKKLEKSSQTISLLIADVTFQENEAKKAKSKLIEAKRLANELKQKLHAAKAEPQRLAKDAEAERRNLQRIADEESREKSVQSQEDRADAEEAAKGRSQMDGTHIPMAQSRRIDPGALESVAGQVLWQPWNNGHLVQMALKSLYPDLLTESPTKRRIVDLSNGEGKFTSLLDKECWDIERYDEVKHGGHLSGNYSDVKPLEWLRKNISTIQRSHVILIDPPYSVQGGGHHLSNCRPASMSFVRKNFMYGVDQSFSKEQILQIYYSLARLAKGAIKDKGYVMVKAQNYDDFPLTSLAVQIFADVGRFKYVTTFQLVTHSNSSSAKENFSSLIVFQKKGGGDLTLQKVAGYLRNGEALEEKIERMAITKYQAVARHETNKAILGVCLLQRVCAYIVEDIAQMVRDLDTSLPDELSAGIAKDVLEGLKKLTAMDEVRNFMKEALKPFRGEKKSEDYYRTMIKNIDSKRVLENYNALVAGHEKKRKLPQTAADKDAANSRAEDKRKNKSVAQGSASAPSAKRSRKT